MASSSRHRGAGQWAKLRPQRRMWFWNQGIELRLVVKSFSPQRQMWCWNQGIERSPVVKLFLPQRRMWCWNQGVELSGGQLDECCPAPGVRTPHCGSRNGVVDGLSLGPAPSMPQMDLAAHHAHPRSGQLSVTLPWGATRNVRRKMQDARQRLVQGGMAHPAAARQHSLLQTPPQSAPGCPCAHTWHVVELGSESLRGWTHRGLSLQVVIRVTAL